MRSLLWFLIGIAIVSPAFCDIKTMRERIPKIVELKDNGLIGEQPDGYLGVVKPDPGAEKTVELENKDRMSEYESRAKTQKQPLQAIAETLGGLRIQQEKPGRFIRKASGEWVKK